ncbi:hypothetical protein DPMN_032571 [Dreissena polymorpha]|uniref:Uncharacterized protein n=1 Tax=Dreissena polymorpha TaxID=45954 RepID=A0A9D4M4F4_DREPO|nr:hypothetical protein DPMN_032571 [Dreissena polymorpha]
MTYDLHGSWEDVTGHNSPLLPHSGETGNQRYLNMVGFRNIHMEYREKENTVRIKTTSALILFKQ